MKRRRLRDGTGSNNPTDTWKPHNAGAELRSMTQSPVQRLFASAEQKSKTDLHKATCLEQKSIDHGVGSRLTDTYMHEHFDTVATLQSENSYEEQAF
jgi:hypothetical protein